MKETNLAAMKTLLIVGPVPPPIGGATMTVQMIHNELAAYYPAFKVDLVNTSPLRDPMEKVTSIEFERMRRMILIIQRYIGMLRKSVAVLVFSNNLFAFTVVPILLLLARIFRKPFYIKPVGGDLDLYIGTLNKPFRWFMLLVLRAADGLLIQTHLLQSALTGLGCKNTYYLPGCRSIPRLVQHKRTHLEELRLIFLSHITRDKGSLVLLEALHLLNKAGNGGIRCDFYGPIHDEIRDEFLQRIKDIPNVNYCGLAEAGTGAQLITAYDALVLPTFFPCEGHPGVIIEAMHAGVPVISTQHRAIPELVTHGKNGILVPVRDSHALADAINLMANDRHLLEMMGKANYFKGHEFRSDQVVSRMLEIILPDIPHRLITDK